MDSTPKVLQASNSSLFKQPVVLIILGLMILAGVLIWFAMFGDSNTPVQRLIDALGIETRACSDAGQDSAQNVICSAPLPSLFALKTMVGSVGASVYTPVEAWREFTPISGVQEWRSSDGWHHMLAQNYKEIRFIDCIGQFKDAGLLSCHAPGAPAKADSSLPIQPTGGVSVSAEEFRKIHATIHHKP